MAIKKLEDALEPTGIADVYVVPREVLARDPRPALINGLLITAVGPHPDLEDLAYVTTGPAALLDFLPDGWWELSAWDRIFGAGA